METQLPPSSRIGSRDLGAFEIGIEHEAGLIESLEKNHPHIGHAVLVDGCQRHAVGVVDLLLRRVFEPLCEERKGSSRSVKSSLVNSVWLIVSSGPFRETGDCPLLRAAQALASGPFVAGRRLPTGAGGHALRRAGRVRLRRRRLQPRQGRGRSDHPHRQHEPAGTAAKGDDQSDQLTIRNAVSAAISRG